MSARCAAREIDAPHRSANEENTMSRKLLAAAALAITLAGCIVVPAHPAYYRPAPVVIY
jgi:hypothetical protein